MRNLVVLITLFIFLSSGCGGLVVGNPSPNRLRVEESSSEETIPLTYEELEREEHSIPLDYAILREAQRASTFSQVTAGIVVGGIMLGLVIILYNKTQFVQSADYLFH